METPTRHPPPIYANKATNTTVGKGTGQRKGIPKEGWTHKRVDRGPAMKKQTNKDGE